MGRRGKNKNKNKHKHQGNEPTIVNVKKAEAIPMGGDEVEVIRPSSALEEKFEARYGRPIVEISPRIHALMCHLHEKIPNCEWSGYGKLEKVDGKYVMVDIRFPEQRNSGSLTEITDDGKVWFCETLMNESPEDDNVLLPWKIWFHSHHRMGVFWSGTDHAAMNSNGDDGAPYFVNIVTSYRNNAVETRDHRMYKATMSLYEPKRFNLDMNVQLGINEEAEQLIENIIAQKVKIAEEEIKGKEEDKRKAYANLDTKYQDMPQATDEDVRKIVETLNIPGLEINAETMVSVKALIDEEWTARKEKEREAIDRIYEVEPAEDMINHDEIIASVEQDFYGEFITARVEELEKNQAKRQYLWHEKHGVARNQDPLWQEENMERIQRDHSLIEERHDDLGGHRPPKAYQEKLPMHKRANISDYEHLPPNLYLDVENIIDVFPKDEIHAFIKERGYSPYPEGDSREEKAERKRFYQGKWFERDTLPWGERQRLQHLGKGPTGKKMRKSSIADSGEPLFDHIDLNVMQRGITVEKNRRGLTWEGSWKTSPNRCNKCNSHKSGYFVDNNSTDERYCEECFEHHFTPRRFR